MLRGGVIKSALFLLLSTTLTQAQDTLLSHTAMADGTCTGLDQVPIISPPWEESEIIIRAVTISGIDQSTQPLPFGLAKLGLQISHPASLYVFAGNSATPDVMAGPVYGSGLGQATATAEEELPRGMPLPADPAKHIDAHIWCTPVGAHYSVAETVWYTVP